MPKWFDIYILIFNFRINNLYSNLSFIKQAIMNPRAW